MDQYPVKLGIVGLGRWARVLARAAQHSPKLKIVAGYTRTQEKRDAFAKEFGIGTVGDYLQMLMNPELEGVILTVPNEQHYAMAAQAARAGKHVYTEKPIAHTLEDGVRIADLEARHGIHVVVGHSARLLAGTRMMKQAIERGELGRIACIEANFSNERALVLTPQDWRWHRAQCPGGPLSQLAIHQFDSLRCLGGEIVEVMSMASKLSPAGAEVDDQSMTLLKFADGKVGYVGSCWTSPGIYSIRTFGQKALMHYEVDFGAWDHPDRLHESSLLYIQRGKDGYGKREALKLPQSNMFLDGLESFAEAIATGRRSELSAANGLAAAAVVNAALLSIERGGKAVAVKEVIEEARASVRRQANAA
jgi:predicted dehydrogenase